MSNEFERFVESWDIQNKVLLSKFKDIKEDLTGLRRIETNFQEFQVKQKELINDVAFLKKKYIKSKKWYIILLKRYISYFILVFLAIFVGYFIGTTVTEFTYQMNTEISTLIAAQKLNPKEYTIFMKTYKSLQKKNLQELEQEFHLKKEYINANSTTK